MIFYTRKPINRISVFSELEANGQQVGEEDNSTEDYTAESAPENQEQETQPEESNTEDYTQESEPQQPEENQEAQDDGGETTDYTQDDNEEESPSNNQQQSSAPVDTGVSSAIDDFKRQEEELYNSLTPEQLDIKHKELKEQFLSMFDLTVSIIERVGEIAVSENKIKVIEYVSSELVSIKDMLSDYIANVYKTKSYIENSINYNRFLVTLNTLNKVLEEISENDD